MTNDSLEGVIRRSANRNDINAHRLQPDATPHGRLAAMLVYHGVDVVLDIGANIGQFAAALREGGYDGRNVPFEPMASAHSALAAASEADEAWAVAPRMAIGDAAGETCINVSANSFSSSIFDVLPKHLDVAPESAYVGAETVSVRPLDAIVGDYVSADETCFLKVDTQGYEASVLAGAKALMTRVAGLHLELSLVPLYDGQPLYDELMERLRSEGFDIWGLWPGIHDPESGRMRQVDATLFRSVP